MKNRTVLIIALGCVLFAGTPFLIYLSQKDHYQGVSEMKVFVHMSAPFDNTDVKLYLCGKEKNVTEDNFKDEIVVVGTDDIPVDTQVSIKKLEYSHESKFGFSPKTTIWVVENHH